MDDRIAALDGQLPSLAEIDQEIARRVSTADIDREFGRRGGYAPEILTRAVDAGWPLRGPPTRNSVGSPNAEPWPRMRHRGLCDLAGVSIRTAPADVVRALRKQGRVEFQNTGSSRRRSHVDGSREGEVSGLPRAGAASVLPSVDGEDHRVAPCPVLDDLTVQGRRLLRARPHGRHDRTAPSSWGLTPRARVRPPSAKSRACSCTGNGLGRGSER